MRKLPLSLGLAFSLLTGFAPAAQAQPPYEPLMWVDLLPFEDFQALFNPPPIDHSGGDDSSAGGLLRNNTGNTGSGLGAKNSDDPQARFEAALVSVNVKPELDQRKVSLPGFIVPLEYNDQERVTSFFLVPYFGACIHTPPPPPNQIMHVTYPQGLELKTIYDPFYIDGVLSTTLVQNQMATAAYSMQAEQIVPYSEADTE